MLSHDPEVHEHKLGLQWLEYAAQAKNQYAAYRLGKEYLKGVIVAKDAAKAVAYLTQSAEAGNQYAQYALGKIYLKAQNREQAHYRFTQSAAQGNSHAQFFLSRWDSLKPPSVMVSATRLLRHMSRGFQEQTPPPLFQLAFRPTRNSWQKSEKRKSPWGTNRMITKNIAVPQWPHSPLKIWVAENKDRL